MIKIGNLKIETKIQEPSLDYIVCTTKLDNLHKSIKELSIRPEWRNEIQDMEFLRAIQGTIALEGSDMKLEEIKSLSEKNSPSTTDREKEAENALNAYKFIEEWSYNNPDTEITETVIRQIHTEITRGLNYLSNEPGQYRNTVVT